MRADANLADVLEEADELLNRYAPRDAAESWARNLEVLATLATIHRLWQDDRAKVGALVREMTPFLRAAFEMGREAARQDR